MTMLLEWIATSTFLILVVLALRAVLKKRISANLRYALWAVVLFRLLVPVQLFTSPVAGTVIFQETRTQITRESRPEQPEKTILPELPNDTKSGQQTVPVLSIPEEFPDPPSVPDPPDAPAPPRTHLPPPCKKRQVPTRLVKPFCLTPCPWNRNFPPFSFSPAPSRLPLAFGTEIHAFCPKTVPLGVGFVQNLFQLCYIFPGNY